MLFLFCFLAIFVMPFRERFDIGVPHRRYFAPISSGEYRFSTDDLSGAHLFHLVRWVDSGRYWCASQSSGRNRNC